MLLSLLTITASAQEGKAPPKPAAPWQAALDAVQAARAAQKFDEALALLDAAIGKHARVAPLHWNRCQLRMRVRNLDGAMADVNLAIELEPRFAFLYEMRAHLHMQDQNENAALVDLDAAIGLSQKSERAFGKRGAIRLDRGDFAGARSDFERAVELAPDGLEARASLARVCLCQGDVQTADAQIRRATRKHPERADLWSLRGEIEFALGDETAAARSFERALAQKPERDVHASVLCSRSDVHVQARRVREAIADAQAATEQASSDATRASANHRLGCLRLADGDRLGAAAAFTLAAKDPTLAPWAALMLWTLAPASAEADETLRQAFAALAKPDTLAVALRDFCLGTRSFDPNDTLQDRPIDERCALWYFAACCAVKAGRQLDADTLFGRAVNTGCWWSRQWHLAVADLTRPRSVTPTTLGETFARDGDGKELVVAKLDRFGAGAQQGLQVGDRITAVNGKAATEAAWAEAMQAVRPGQRVTLSWIRGGNRLHRSLLAGIDAE
jgi:tetratricopeptide (TPR) repeat protein